MSHEAAMPNTSPSSRLSPALRWALGASALASVWALWWPQSPGAGEPTPAVTPAPKSSAAPGIPPAPVPKAGPTENEVSLSPASRDPFQLPPPPPPPPAPNAAAKTAADASPPPPPPAAPPMTHRVFGSIQDPDGLRLVFLVDGAQQVLAVEGAALSSGYVVKTVTATEIRLRHPLAEQDVTLPLPAADSR